MISFALPFLAVPITAATYLVFGFSWQGWMVISAVVGFLMLAMFITFGFAVAQQLNDMKNLALTQQIRLTKAYRRFVPPQLLQNLGRTSILDVKLGDQVDVEMSILFSDIRSFTAISEAMSPSENFAFVNAYLSRINLIIVARRGYIDKFMGDGVMALFPGIGKRCGPCCGWRCKRNCIATMMSRIALVPHGSMSASASTRAG